MGMFLKSLIFFVISMVSAWQWTHQGEKEITMKGFPSGISSVFNQVVLSMSWRGTEGMRRPSKPVLGTTGARKAEKRDHPMSANKARAVEFVSHLSGREGVPFRAARMPITPRIMQAVLKATCCFGVSSSMIPPQLQ